MPNVVDGTYARVAELLEKQLQLLYEKSKEAEGLSLANISDVMARIAQLLIKP